MEFMELLKVIFLGIVEGITEWLPISSTGHMLLADEFISLHASEAFKELFIVVIQLGAIFAVVILFWNKIFPFQFKGEPVIRKESEARFQNIRLVPHCSRNCRVSSVPLKAIDKAKTFQSYEERILP